MFRRALRFLGLPRKGAFLKIQFAELTLRNPLARRFTDSGALTTFALIDKQRRLMEAKTPRM